MQSLVVGDPGYLAIVDGREVWQHDADGAWTQLASVEGAKALCVFPTVDQLFVGASEAQLYSLRNHTLEPVHSLESAEGREDWYTPWGGAPDVRSIAADPTGTIYVNVHVGGILRSADGGASWQPTIDVDTDAHQVIFDATSELLLAATGVGFAISTDRGDSWQIETEGLHGTYLRAVAVARDTILIAASTGPSTKRGAIYRRSMNGDQAFERCRGDLPEWFSDNIDTFCLAARNSEVVFGTSDGQVFASSDQGQTWSLLAERLPRVLSVLLAPAAR